MGPKYQKRLNLGNGLGLNFSKSGVSLSFRTKWRAFGTKGYSIRTGIQGLYFRVISSKNGRLGWLVICKSKLVWQERFRKNKNEEGTE